MVLADANSILDVLTADPVWETWSRGAVRAAFAEGVYINQIIYAELAAAYASEIELQDALRDLPIQYLNLPFEAAWGASRAFVRYRRAGGLRRSPMPDFYIGAHCEVSGLKLLTRDAARYRTYFPRVALITPEA